MVIAMVTMVTVVTVTATAFLGYVLDIVTLRILEVMLSCFKLVWAVCSVCCKPGHSARVEVERGNVAILVHSQFEA